MKLYTTPGGHWAGTQKQWEGFMKLEGLDPRKHEIEDFTREVPTTPKAAFMEWLTFHKINLIVPPPRAEDGVVVQQAEAPDLDELFANAPIGQQLRLAVVAIDAAIEAGLAVPQIETKE